MFNTLDKDDFEYVYRGGFSQSISKKILALAEANVLKTTEERSLKKRIYFLMVEGLQNITKHGEKDEAELDGEVFAIQKHSDRYFITTGNAIKKGEEKILKPKLEQINLLEKNQLKKLRKEILISGKISHKGGAGLGLIEMARKSGKQLVFDFDPVDKETSFFYFRTEISSHKEDNKKYTERKDSKATAHSIKKFDQELKNENVLVSFNGQFNRDTILNILSIIKGQMNITKTSKKIYALMVEMLQNISKHTAHLNEDLQNKGVFLFSKQDGNFVLTSGNCICKKELQPVKNKIETINNLSQSELYDQYDKILLAGEGNDERRTGLGFIDMRIKTKAKLKIYNKKYDNKHHFIAIQATVQL